MAGCGPSREGAAGSEELHTLEKTISLTGPSKEGIKMLLECFSHSVEVLQTGNIRPLKDFLRLQLQDRSNQWSKYKVSMRDPMADSFGFSDQYGKKLLEKYPLLGEDDSYVTYNPAEISRFGKELKAKWVSQLGKFKMAEESAMDRILDERLAKNVLAKIMHDFDKDLNNAMKKQVFGKDEDVLRMHEMLRDRCVAEFYESAKRFNAEVTKKALEFMATETEKRKPDPEAVWKARAEEMLQVAKTKHLELLESVRAECLDKVHTTFYDHTISSSENPFPKGSDWFERLREMVKRELDNILVEVKARRQNRGEKRRQSFSDTSSSSEDSEIEVEPETDPRRRLNLVLYGLKDAQHEDYGHLCHYISTLLETATKKKVRFTYARRIGNFRKGAERPRPVKIRFFTEFEKKIVYEHRGSQYFAELDLRLAQDLPQKMRHDQAILRQEAERIRKNDPNLSFTIDEKKNTIFCEDGRKVVVKDEKVSVFSSSSSSCSSSSLSTLGASPESPSKTKSRPGKRFKVSSSSF